MYSLWSNLEIGALFLVAFFAWRAGASAAKLRYGGSAERLKRKTRRTVLWMALLLLSIGLQIWSALEVWAYSPWMLSQDFVSVHLPLVVMPTLFVIGCVLPRIYWIARESGRRTGAPLDPELFRQASHPLLVVPLRATALCALTAIYFFLAVPVPFVPADVMLPLMILGLVVVFAANLAWHRWKRLLNDRNASAATLPPLWKRSMRALAMLAVVGAIATGGIALNAQASRLPDHVRMDEGTMDYGGGTDFPHVSSGQVEVQAASASAGAPAVPVTELTGDVSGTPDRRFALTAQKTQVKLGSGKTKEAWTFDGQLPGPELRMRQGELVEVVLTNRDIAEGVTIHWHGLDIPNAQDGVAGATQNAVRPGESFVYRFRPEQTGTFWYHSHQDSQEAVKRGLFGPLVVEPAAGQDPKVKDIVALANERAFQTSDPIRREAVAPGTPVRLRLISTDDWVIRRFTLVGTPFRVAAIDGTELNKPGELTDTHLELTTGSRADLVFTMPDHPVFLSVGGSKNRGILLSKDGTGEIPDIPATRVFNPLHYGEPADVPFDDKTTYDRNFTMLLDNKFGFYNGSFTNLYTINGKVFPKTPMFMVRQGEKVRVTIANHGQVDHPMHLHGHHMLVLSRNGERSTGSPWWSDTLDVRQGDVYEVAFVADNPGLWMDHCHNLSHAAVGMSMHLMYEGVTTPFEVGSASFNRPE
ncbi:multicopper oxidase family protein [Cohnella sp. REN36]|uniref:multicopper oxidase family protein n=1 Tax=Cohnella sp. REN36 TaxID=2887347 RepID=UPI001D1486D5|nr:multicopper oxidase family protein [Cohnella sp. REN36]MCC3375124.1 multicopper oxidase domain-containing protein [Cohnella sp. REN36]